MVIPCQACKRWPGGGSRRLARERIQDDGMQEVERVRKRNLHNAEGTFTGILFCIRVLQVDCTGGRRIIQWDVPEQWLGGSWKQRAMCLKNGEALGRVKLFTRRLAKRICG